MSALGITLIVIGFAGVGLTLWLRRPSPIPLCRKCGYELSGKTAPGKCPECACWFTELKKPYRRPLRKAHVIFAIAAIALLLFGGYLQWKEWEYRRWESKLVNVLTFVSPNEIHLIELASRVRVRTYMDNAGVIHRFVSSDDIEQVKSDLAKFYEGMEQNRVRNDQVNSESTQQ